jgi:hypothetical protein
MFKVLQVWWLYLSRQLLLLCMLAPSLLALQLLCLLRMELCDPCTSKSRVSRNKTSDTGSNMLNAFVMYLECQCGGIQGTNAIA